MAYIGIDRHKTQRQRCRLTAAGEILPSASPRNGKRVRWSVPGAPQPASRSALVDRTTQGRGLLPGGARCALRLDRRRRMR